MADDDTTNQSTQTGGAGDDDASSVINLSDAQIKEAETTDTSEVDNILLDEAELLGLGDEETMATAQGGGTPIPGAVTTKKPQASKYHIPAIVHKQYPDLVKLILETESMDDEEREYWFQILPIMTSDQVEKFREILVSEKEQLKKLDEEYEAELAKINEQHLSEWQAFENQQQREDLAKKEEAHEAEEANLEEDLLNKLQEL